MPDRISPRQNLAHVVCAGNELCRDDGVGIRVGRLLRRLRLPGWAEVHLFQEIGWDLMDVLATPARVVVVDATFLGLLPGQLTVARFDAVASMDVSCVGCHGLGLPALVELAAALCPDRRRLGVTLVGIEAERLDGFSITLSPSVRRAVPRAARCVLSELGLTDLWTEQAEASSSEVCGLDPTLEQAHAG